MASGFLTPRLDRLALRDATWWSWVVMISLLAARLSGGSILIVWLAVAVCAAMMVMDIILRRGDLRAMSVQIRIGYLILLMLGLLPGMAWIHWMQLIGTSVRVLTGYCLLHRELLMLPWNSQAPMTAGEMWRILLTPPGDGGLFRLSDASRAMPNPCSPGV
jgi:hypothetical protein